MRSWVRRRPAGAAPLQGAPGTRGLAWGRRLRRAPSASAAAGPVGRDASPPARARRRGAAPAVAGEAGLPGCGPACLSRVGRGRALRAESPAAGRGTLLLFGGLAPAATPIKIRTAGRSAGARGPASTRPAPRPTCAWQRRVGAGLQRAPFSGRADSAGELQHTPWGLPTFMATPLLSGSAHAVWSVRPACAP